MIYRLGIALILFASPALAQEAQQNPALVARVQSMLGSQALTIADLQSQLEAARAKIAEQDAEIAKLKGGKK